MHKNLFFKKLEEHVNSFGGLYNAHTHIDRYNTAGQEYLPPDINYQELEVFRIWDKQSATKILHRGKAYSRKSLQARMAKFLKNSIKIGVAKVDSFVDITEDISLDLGCGALNVALEFKKKFASQIDFRVGAYAPFGFTKNSPETYEIFEKAAKSADFIASSPEKDDPEFYGAEKNHIGIKKHFEITLQLAFKLGKPVHYHLDQQVNPLEKGTELLVQSLEKSPYRDELVFRGADEPVIWAVHVISPTTYTEARFTRLLNKLAALNIGVICCPSAGLSMLKLKFLNAPIHSSIAAILPMLKHGIPVRLGTDNVDDIFLPATSIDPRGEIAFLANMLRYYNPKIYAKLLCGKSMDNNDLAEITEFLATEERLMDTYQKTIVTNRR